MAQAVRIICAVIEIRQGLPLALILTHWKSFRDSLGSKNEQFNQAESSLLV